MFKRRPYFVKLYVYFRYTRVCRSCNYEDNYLGYRFSPTSNYAGVTESIKGEINPRSKTEIYEKEWTSD